MRSALPVIILTVVVINSASSAGGVMTGGFSEVAGETGTDPDVRHVMDFFSSEVKNSMFQGEACEFVDDDIDKVERQVVAGMNYRLAVSLRYSCTIPGGAKEVVVRCEEIRVFVPLPVYCNGPNPDNPKCMDLLETVDDKCSRDDPPKPGGFSDARADPDVLDFAKFEVKNSMLGYESDNCDVELDNVGRVESQVVQGTNYRITFSLKQTCTIPGGSQQSAINCEEVVVYVPLSVYCNDPNPANPKCMEISERIEEKCSISPINDPPAPGGLAGGFSDAMSDPASTDVLNFAKLEAKNSLLEGYGSGNCDVELDNISRVESQVVAGTNYRITFSLKSTCTVPGGRHQVGISCEEVVVYVPLSVYCQNTDPDNPKCMEMSERFEEKCIVSPQ